MITKPVEIMDMGQAKSQAFNMFHPYASNWEDFPSFLAVQVLSD
ncbi:MAG TPA: hypothetical protein VK699_20210 [Terriglobales bacterium]|jgi:hypothetical protein|nr:hypothetical protein [Terriglobales bacterium]